MHHLLPGLLLLCLFLKPFAALAGEPFRVVVSIKPIHSLVAGLMQGMDAPALLVPAGRTPYGHQLDETQVAELQAADLVFWVGPELERFLIEPITHLSPATRLETLLDNPELKILPVRWSDEERDPFFWLDSRNAIILVDEIAKRLIETDPAHAHLYKRNRKALLERVAELDRRFEYGYRGFKGGVGLAYFDTLQYFEQAYALKIGNTVTSLQHGRISGESLLGNRLKLSRGEFACLLLEQGVEAKELPLLLEADNPVPRAELDTFGVGFIPGPELYFQLMEYNTDTIKACLNPQYAKSADAEPTAETGTESLYPAHEPIEGKFLLIDHDNRLVREEDLLGRYQLLAFGYTSCPDICPTSLQVMTLALQKLGSRAALIQPYFITIDPERDTVPVMSEYVRYFDIGLIGLTGSQNMIERVARQYHVRYEKVVEEGRDPDHYLMDHTASLFLIAPDGRFVTKFAYGINADQLVAKLGEYLPTE